MYTHTHTHARARTHQLWGLDCIVRNISAPIAVACQYLRYTVTCVTNMQMDCIMACDSPVNSWRISADAADGTILIHNSRSSSGRSLKRESYTYDTDIIAYTKVGVLLIGGPFPHLPLEPRARRQRLQLVLSSSSSASIFATSSTFLACSCTKFATDVVRTKTRAPSRRPLRLTGVVTGATNDVRANRLLFLLRSCRKIPDAIHFLDDDATACV